MANQEVITTDQIGRAWKMIQNFANEMTEKEPLMSLEDVERYSFSKMVTRDISDVMIATFEVNLDNCELYFL